MQAEDGFEVLGIFAKLNRTIDQQQKDIDTLTAALSEKQQIITKLLQDRESENEEKKEPEEPR